MRGSAWHGLLAVGATLILSACGGDKAPGAPGDAGKPPAADVETPATPAPLMFSDKPATSAPPEPITGVDRILGGTPNRRAAAIVRDQLKAAGYLVPGIEVFVLPVSGTYEEVLVVEIDESAAQGSGGAASPIGSSDPTPFLKALASLETSEIANVTRVVFNLHGVDAGVRTVVTIVLPYAAVTAAAQGEQAADDLFAQMQFEVRPEAAP